MKPPRGDTERLHDMLDAIAAIQRHPAASPEVFAADEVLRIFTLKQVEIIGEAILKTSPGLKSAHPEVPWSAVEKTRHVFVHDYFEIEWEKLWRIVNEHLEPLRLQIEAILKEREGHG
jgi:uncharacterized protein with HEPN domain